MSKVAAAPPGIGASAPRWTPPIPPVAKTRIPAAYAAIIVADTVVAAQPPVGEGHREARPGGLADATRRRRGQLLERLGIEADEQLARRGSRPSPASHPPARTAASEAPATSQVLRIWQAVADERRFERDDGPTGGHGVGDLRRDPEPLGDSLTGLPCRQAYAARLRCRPCRSVAR